MAEKWRPGLYCDRCQNTGEVNCYCGGDLCVCGRQEFVCPRCDGRSADDGCWDEEDDVNG